MKESVLIVAGENSGEKYGAELVRQFQKRHPSIHFFGIGGKYMENQGVDLLFTIQDLSVVGIAEILRDIPRIKKILNRMKKEVWSRSPSAAVLIDSPDFNLRLAKTLNKHSIPVLYYISPTIWVWRKRRIKAIKKNVTRMLLIFPFEEEIYKKKGIPAIFIGHPLLERIRLNLSKKDFLQKYKIEPSKNLISLLPGSRKSELIRHMPVLNSSLQKLEKSFPSQYILLKAENLDGNFVSNLLPPSPSVQTLEEDFYEALAYSDLALSSCGTANLEAALLQTPFVSFYRLSPLTYHLARNFARVNHFSIVNILAGESIVPELIQNHFTPQNIFEKAQKILGSETIQSEMIRQFRKVRNILGEKKASLNATKELEKIMRGNRD